MVGTYAKAAVAAIPGAGKLPFVPGGGGDLPQLSRQRSGVVVARAHVERYARVCGFPVRDSAPGTYPHVLAFPMHMSLMTDRRFPFGAVGLVHLENRITQHRPVRVNERLDIAVRTGTLEPHPVGRTFSLLTEVHVGGELVWEEESTMLRRGGGSGERSERAEADVPPRVSEWKLPGDLGRRYGSVSGDRNPIHMHPLTARAFGFPRAIAHGMWTKARCLAELADPGSFTTEVEFRKPVFLPSTVAFHSHGSRFEVRSRDKQHLVGTLSA